MNTRRSTRSQKKKKDREGGAAGGPTSSAGSTRKKPTQTRNKQQPVRTCRTTKEWVAYMKEMGYDTYDADGNPHDLVIPQRDKEAIRARDRINTKKSLGKLTEDEIAALEAIGFVFTGTRADKWKRNVAMLADFKKEKGHLNVTPSNATQWSGLFDFAHNIRAAARDRRQGRGARYLTDERVAELEAMGFNFFPGKTTSGKPSPPSEGANDASPSSTSLGGTNDLVVPSSNTDRASSLADMLADPEILDLDWIITDPTGVARSLLCAQSSPTLIAKTASLLGSKGFQAILRRDAVAAASYLTKYVANAKLASEVPSQGGAGAEAAISSDSASLVVIDDDVDDDDNVDPPSEVVAGGAATRTSTVVTIPFPRARMSMIDFALYFAEHFTEYDAHGKAKPLTINRKRHPKVASAIDRINRKRNDMTPEQIKAFEDVGFVFKATRTQVERWQDTLSMIREHKEAEGHLDITPSTAEPWPDLYSHVKNYRADWRSRQQGHSCRYLNDERFVELEAMEFNFNPTGMTFDNSPPSEDALNASDEPSPPSVLADEPSPPSESVINLVGSPSPVPGASTIVPFSNTAYETASGSVAGDGRCGTRAAFQALFLLLGKERFVAHLRQQRIKQLPPDYNFAWGRSLDLCKWLDEMWQRCFKVYCYLVHKEGRVAASRLPQLQDFVKVSYTRDMATDEFHRVKAVYDDDGSIGNPSSARLMDDRTGFSLGYLLDVNIYAVVEGESDARGRGVYTSATSGITVRLNYDGRHYDNQGHLP